MRGIKSILIITMMSFLSMIGCVGCQSVDNKTPDVPKLNAYQISAQSAVRIVMMHKSNNTAGAGSGNVFYRSEPDKDLTYTYRLLTASHIIPQTSISNWHWLLTGIDVSDTYNTPRYLCNSILQVEILNRDLDYAIIAFQSKVLIETMKASHDPKPVRLGQQIIMSGCDSGALPLTRSGCVALSRYVSPSPKPGIDYHTEHPEDIFAITITGSQGASGACVMNLDGECVGVYVAMLAGPYSVYQNTPIGISRTPLFVQVGKPHINIVIRYSAIYKDLVKQDRLDLLGTALLIKGKK